MAKRPGKTTAGLTRKQVSRAKREAKLQRWLLIGTAIILIAVISIIGFAFFNEQVLVPNQSIATINNDEITVAEFQKQLEFIWYQQVYPQLGLEPLSAYGFDEQTYAKYILDAMVDNSLIHQKAEEKSITVSNTNIEEQIQLFFGYDTGKTEPTATPIATVLEDSPTATSTPVYTLTPRPTMTLEPGITPSATPTYTATPTGKETPTPTLPPQPTTTPLSEQAFNDIHTRWLEIGTEVTSLSKEHIDELLHQHFHNQLLREELIEALSIDVHDTKIMIHAAHILVNSEEEAKTVLERLAQGEEFETLAAELSIDTNNAYKGGDLGWFGPGEMDLVFEDTAKTIPIGMISTPVQTQFGWHLIKVYARTEVATTAQEQQSQKQEKFQEMLDQWNKEAKIVIESDWANYLPPQFQVPTATPVLIP